MRNPSRLGSRLQVRRSAQRDSVPFSEADSWTAWQISQSVRCSMSSACFSASDICPRLSAASATHCWPHCYVSHFIGFGDSLSNIIIGAIMPLIPGVPFVNGVRDLMNSDYIAGLTRLTDAMLGFFCIAIGVSIAFMLDGWIAGGIIDLGGMTINPETAGLGWQTLAAFIGTFAFAILFGSPRKQYTAAGLIGALGWAAFLIMVRTDLASTFAAIILATALICIFSRIAAVLDRCPSTVFLLCGIFPLVPGAGVFWFTYYMVSSQFSLSSTTGFNALKAAIAIVLGIVFAMELPQRLFSGFKRFRRS